MQGGIFTAAADSAAAKATDGSPDLTTSVGI